MMASLVADKLAMMGESGGTRYDQTEGTKLWLSRSRHTEEGPPYDAWLAVSWFRVQVSRIAHPLGGGASEAFREVF